MVTIVTVALLPNQHQPQFTIHRSQGPNKRSAFKGIVYLNTLNNGENKLLYI